MTEHFKNLLHDFGLLYVTLHRLEEKHSKEKKISLQDHDSSLGELLPGEPALIVKISKDGKSEFIDYVEKEDHTNEKSGYENVKILELPEDEYYFFEAFRSGIFNLEQEIPNFMYNMWITHTFGLFENYLVMILKSRFFVHPKLLSTNKTLTLNDLLVSESKDALLERFIDLEVRELLYLPINGILGKMRDKFGFKKLIMDYDLPIRRISLIRNCLVHNGSLVSDKLANEFPSEFILNDKIPISIKIADEVITNLRKLAFEIDKTFESINMK